MWKRAATSAAAGMVTIQAKTILVATFHRTADTRARSAHADDRPRNRMGRRHRDTEPSRYEQCRRSARLCAEALHRCQARNLRAHRLDDAPATEERSEAPWRPGSLSPPRTGRRTPAEMALGEQQSGDDAHGLLCVITAVPKRIKRSRAELKTRKVRSTAKGVFRTKSKKSREPERGPTESRPSAKARSPRLS